MIEGNSGSGKTSLALGMLSAARQRQADFKFICDDQAILQIKGKELWAWVPKSIAGKVELHGLGITPIDYRESCRIDLVCELIAQDEIERYPAQTKCLRHGISIDYIQTPGPTRSPVNSSAAAQALSAHLNKC